MLAAWRGNEAEALGADRGWEARGDGEGRGHGAGRRSSGPPRCCTTASGRYAEALAAAQRGCEHDDVGLFAWALVELIEAGVRSGATDAASAALDRLSERTQASGTDWALGIEAGSRALLSDGRDAEPLYREAVERLARSRGVVHLARARLLYGEWLRRENRRVDAREQLRAAYDRFSRIGAEAFAERARRELLATGETAPRRTVETRDVLTPQEAQIARMASDRQTNPEIGAKLFISPRTVEYHLRKVFTKLDISSRKELTRRACRNSRPRRCHNSLAMSRVALMSGPRWCIRNERHHMKIVVIGGTGLIGSKLVTKLDERGHETVAASPDTGVNTLTGEGLADAVAGASVVVDVSNAPSFEDAAVLEFFDTSTRNLLAAEAAGGVGHHVALSVVGTERLTESGYFRAKLAQEKLIKVSSIPYSIVRATQFFEFMDSIAATATDGDTVRLPPALIQPMAADDVAAAVGQVAVGPPVQRHRRDRGTRPVPARRTRPRAPRRQQAIPAR